MNSKSFFKTLRKIIREEVQSAVSKALTESKVNHQQVISHGMDLHKISEQASYQQPIAKAPQTYTKNKMLNDLLNETAYSPNGMVEQEPWPAMDFGQNAAQAFGMQRQQPLSSKPIAAPVTDIKGVPVNMNNQSVATAVNAMNIDYSAKLKAMENATKRRRGG